MASKLLKIPDYCETFEFKLVEELSLSDPLDFHFGKCIAIGRLARNGTAFYLENIQLKFMSQEYQLPTGSERVYLLLSIEEECNFVAGAFAEVHGEAAHWRSDLGWSERGPLLPKTTRDIIVEERFNHYNFDDLDSQAIVDEKEIPAESRLKDVDVDNTAHRSGWIWRPAINVYTMNSVNDAEELIHCNLKMRLLRKKHMLMIQAS